MIDEKYQSFLCHHHDEPQLLKAYCVGYKEACEWFLNWAKEYNVKMGSIENDDLGGIYAQIDCNYTMNNYCLTVLTYIEDKKDD